MNFLSVLNLPSPEFASNDPCRLYKVLSHGLPNKTFLPHTTLTGFFCRMEYWFIMSKKLALFYMKQRAGLIMLRLLLFFVSFSAFAGPRLNFPPGGFRDNFWQQVQIQHLQTQQQLQSQDQYRRLLLLQDQQRQIERLQDQQYQFEYLQRNAIMHEHSDRLRMYSRPVRVRPEVVKKKTSK